MTRLRMVATDLDGTFLGASGLPSEENVSAAREAAKRGITLVFATGRPARWLQALEPLMSEHPKAITSNGAVIFDVQAKRVLRAHRVPRNDTIEFAHQLAKSLPGITFGVEYTHGWGRNPDYPVRGDRVEADVISTSVAELVDGGHTVKLLAIHPNVNTHDMAATAFPLLNGRLSGTFAIVLDAGLLEFAAPGVSKASALIELMQAQGIDRNELAAFGDMPNDAEMLELAGYPFIMDNSHPSLLDRGFPRAGHHDDSGFGRTLRRLLDELAPDVSPDPDDG